MTAILVAGPDPAVAGAVAEGLADLGSTVLLTAAEPAGAIPSVRADLADLGSVANAVAVAAAEHGTVGAAVVLPAPAPDRAIEEVDEALWRETLDGNVTVAMHVARAAAPAIADAGGGSIALVTWRDQPGARRSHVAAAAGAVGMLARALAVELGPEGVRVNAVAVPPGEAAAAVPTLRLLLSPEAGYLTGEVLEVGGVPA